MTAGYAVSSFPGAIEDAKMSRDERRLTIAELERETGLSRTTIYHYQKKGLLPPVERVGGNPANYRVEHLERLLRVKALKESGLTLKEVGSRLDPVADGSVVDRSDLAAQHANAVRVSIIDAASRAFAAKGYIGGTINEVCAIAGITPKTFYRYFSSKHELFLEVGESLVGKWLSIKEPRLLGEPDSVKRHLMKISGYLSLSSILPDLLIFLKAEAQSGDELAHRILVSIYDTLAGTFIDDFRELRSGSDDPRHDDEMLTYALVGAIQDSGLKLGWDSRYTARDYLRLHLDLYLALRGLYIQTAEIDEERRAELDRFVEELVENPPFGQIAASDMF